MPVLFASATLIKAELQKIFPKDVVEFGPEKLGKEYGSVSIVVASINGDELSKLAKLNSDVSENLNIQAYANSLNVIFS